MINSFFFIKNIFLILLFVAKFYGAPEPLIRAMMLNAEVKHSFLSLTFLSLTQILCLYKHRKRISYNKIPKKKKRKKNDKFSPDGEKVVSSY